MRIQRIELDYLKQIAQEKQFKSVDLNSAIGILSNMGKNAIAKIKTYSNGKEVLVIYVYDESVHRFIIYDEVPMS